MDARCTHKYGQDWRIRFINEKSGYLNTGFYRTWQGLERRANAVEANPDFTLVDLSFWHHGLAKWVEY